MVVGRAIVRRRLIKRRGIVLWTCRVFVPPPVLV